MSRAPQVNLLMWDIGGPDRNRTNCADTPHRAIRCHLLLSAGRPADAALRRFWSGAFFATHHLRKMLPKPAPSASSELISLEKSTSRAPVKARFALAKKPYFSVRYAAKVRSQGLAEGGLFVYLWPHCRRTK
jgi:hypothetical protein